MVELNPEIMKWARETAGFNRAEASKKLGIAASKKGSPEERLALYEEGEEAPTRNLLDKMAKQYHRPVLTFYLNSPPEKGDRGEDFRTLPGTISRRQRSMADTVVRDIRARQILIRNALEDEGDAKALPFINSMTIEDGVERVAGDIAATIKFDLKKYRSTGGADKASKGLRYIRDQVQAVGIFVIFVDKLGGNDTEIHPDCFRGFALADEIAPIIAININDSKGAQVFTMIHELAHLWLGATGVSDSNFGNKVEKFCNNVASAFLLPEGIAQIDVNDATPHEEAFRKIGNFANSNNVSISMVAYSLHQAGKMSSDQLGEIINRARTLFLRHKKQKNEALKNSKNKKGPNYHVVRRHRAGQALIDLAKRMLGNKLITTAKAGRILGVNGKAVGGMIQGI